MKRWTMSDIAFLKCKILVTFAINMDFMCTFIIHWIPLVFCPLSLLICSNIGRFFCWQVWKQNALPFHTRFHRTYTIPMYFHANITQTYLCWIGLEIVDDGEHGCSIVNILALCYASFHHFGLFVFSSVSFLSICLSSGGYPAWENPKSGEVETNGKINGYGANNNDKKLNHPHPICVWCVNIITLWRLLRA